MNALTSVSGIGRTGLTLGLLGMAACGSSNSGPSPFNGSWSCTGSKTYTFTSPSTSKPYTVADPASEVVISDNDGEPITFTFGSSTNDVVGDGGSGCSLTYAPTGTTATLDPGQKCPVKVTDGAFVYSVDIQYLSGTADVSATTLSSTTTASFSGTLAVGSTTTPVMGTVSGNTSCTN